MIAGFNSDGETPAVPADYFFTSVLSIWGWASWRRVIDRWEGDYAFLNDDFAMRQLRGVMRQRRYCKDTLRACYNHRASGKEYYETIFWASMLLESGLAVMPTKNMINNRGATGDSTHFAGNLHTMPHRLRRLFTMPRHEVAFPLRHPRYIIENTDYKERVYRTFAYGHPLIKVGRSLEELWLNLRYGNFRFIFKSLWRRIGMWTGRVRHR